METAARAEAAPPPTGDETGADRMVTVTASTDPRKALADIAQQRAESVRRNSWRRAAQAVLVLAVLAAALMIPRFREHSLAAAPVSSAATAAARASSILPAAISSAPAARSDAERVVVPEVAAPEDPSARCETQFKARSWRSAIESCSAAFDETASAALAMRIAHAHFSHGDAAGAGSWAYRALELGTTDPDVYVLIGNAEHAAGKRRKATAAYRRYLELAPHGWHAARLRSIMGVTPAARTAP